MTSDYLYLQQRKMDRMRSLQAPYEIDVLGKKLIVHPRVFYPATDTELLIETVKPRVFAGDRVLEPFAGTGAIGIHLAPYVDSVLAVDKNPYAVKNIRENAQAHRLEHKITALQADIFPKRGTFDLIIINPPYSDQTARDEIEASMWDKDHATVKKFFERARNYLTTHGSLYTSWANFADFTFLEDLMEKEGYCFSSIAEKTKENKTYKIYQVLP